MSAAQALDNVTQFPAMEVPRKSDDSGVPSAVPASLFIKLFAIMQDMDGIPMRGEHSQKWSFMRSDDVFNGARKAFLKHRVLVIPGVLPNTVSQRDGDMNKFNTTSIRSVVVFTYTFIDVDTGQSYMTTWAGESQDFSDKGIQQAGTSSMKYMLMKLFLATPDHDPDYNTGEQKTTTPTAGGGTKVDTSLSGNGNRRIGTDTPAPEPQAETVTFISAKVKYIGGGNSAYVAFAHPDGDAPARLYGRDKLRELSADMAAFADALTPGAATQDAKELPKPVVVTAMLKTGDSGFSYWLVTKLAVQS
jgi:hypothetical protein